MITHELLNEMIGNRYPQTAEVRILREYIKTESHQLSVEQKRPPTAVTNAVSRRSEGIKFHQRVRLAPMTVSAMRRPTVLSRAWPSPGRRSFSCLGHLGVPARRGLASAASISTSRIVRRI